jgi:hypothetical protein
MGKWRGWDLIAESQTPEENQMLSLDLIGTLALIGMIALRLSVPVLLMWLLGVVLKRLVGPEPDLEVDIQSVPVGEPAKQVREPGLAFP